jgi:hypothetical protein
MSMQYIALWEGYVGRNDVTIILCNGLSDWISEYDAFHTSFNTWKTVMFLTSAVGMVGYMESYVRIACGDNSTQGWGFPARNHK